MEPSTSVEGAELDATLRARLTSLRDEGQRLWYDFDAGVRRHAWHPFVPADFERVLRALAPLRGSGTRFLEWGSGMGVITIMADMLGFEACGIELDPELAAVARRLAHRFGSGARLVHGSFLPDGYEWRPASGDNRLGTIGTGPSGYAELDRSLSDFDIVFAYPWGGEEDVMLDVMRRCGSRDGRLLLHGASGIDVHLGGSRLGSEE